MAGASSEVCAHIGVLRAVVNRGAEPRTYDLPKQLSEAWNFSKWFKAAYDEKEVLRETF